MNKNAPPKKVKLSDITPDGHNPNKGTVRGVHMIETSLQRLGAGRSILLDKNNKVIAGNKTLESAVSAGFENVRVIDTTGDEIIAVRRIDMDLDDDTGSAREMSVADNRAAQTGIEWDADVVSALVEDGADLSQYFHDDELAELLAGMDDDVSAVERDDPGAEVDRAEELQDEWKTETGQLWQCGRHKILCENATNEENTKRLIGSVDIDGIVTDPPYCSGGFQEGGRGVGSIGVRDGKKIASDTLSTRGYNALLKKTLETVPKCPTIYIFTDWRMWVNLFDVVESSGFGVRSMIVWDKKHFGLGRGWRNQHELIMYGTKAKSKFGSSDQGNVISLPRENGTEHPTEKPLPLMENILNVSKELLNIYDPFLGSGTTLIAAEQLNRTGYGMEIDPAYVAVTLERFDKMGIKPELIK